MTNPPWWLTILAFWAWAEIVLCCAILQKYCVRFVLASHKDIWTFNFDRLRRRVHAYWHGGDWEHTK